MNVFLSKFMMYYKIHQLHRDCKSISQISKYLVLNRRTVTRYLAMSEGEYEEFLIQQGDRKKELLPYESFVKNRLMLFQDTPSAQMHDWLKEHHSDFPKVNPKTVFNFVNWIRSKYNLPKESRIRQHETVEELPYGKQAQVDFGEYNLRTSLGTRVKVFFFVLVLSRSRFKYAWFTDHYFTSDFAIEAHELAFGYIKGIPDELVYDQDKVFITDENKGDIILTDKFRAYTKEKGFGLHFCRKADPQSKGKVENTVKYIKQNFLYNRTFFNIETLNDDVMGWLGRTANALPHAFTQKTPYSEWIIEQPFLKPYTASVFKPTSITYSVRKDNTISYKGNLYSLPLGTYTGRGCVVDVSTESGVITILKNGVELCHHNIEIAKGQKIIKTDHKRDKSSPIDEMIRQICLLFENPIKINQWLSDIRKDKPRYSRDQLILIKKTIELANPEVINRAVDYCINNKILKATDFKSIVNRYKMEQPEIAQVLITRLNPLGGDYPHGAVIQPEKSQIENYQAIFNNNN